MIKDKLNFQLHDFLRITWVSEELKAEWESLITDLPKVIEDLFTSKALISLIPIQIKFISTNNLYGYKKLLFSKGVFAEHINNIAPVYKFAFGTGNVTNRIPLIVGNRRSVIDFISRINEIDNPELTNELPETIISFWSKYSNIGLIDRFWAYLSTKNDFIKNESIQENNILNPFWRVLGISALPYNPINLNCAKSLEIAYRIKEIAEKSIPEKLFKAWYEILSYPIEWSALHGIAETKTPLFKMIYNTDATGTKYNIQLKSEFYPERGLNGLLFPYRKPKKLFFSESKRFQKGVAQITNSLNKKLNNP